MTNNQINHARNLIQARYNQGALQEQRRSNRANESLKERDLISQHQYRKATVAAQERKTDLEHGDRVYSTDRNYTASIYASNASASAHRYAADQSRAASQYASDNSYAASIYASDNQRAASKYASDRNYSGTIYSADTSRYNTTDQVNASYGVARINAGAKYFDTSFRTVVNAGTTIGGWFLNPANSQ